MTAPSGDGLAVLGLGPGDPVRWRAPGGTRWQRGQVRQRERDGSVAVTDSRGGRRSLAVERLEVPCRGPRGGTSWERLTDRVARAEQLHLL